MFETFWQKSADADSEEALVSCDTFVVMSDVTVSGEVSPSHIIHHDTKVFFFRFIEFNY